jgi:hypothetical protein
MADEQAQYAFKVSDALPAGVDGREKASDPWICLEPVYSGLSILKNNNRNLGFVLREGTSQEEAEKVVDYLNKHIKALTIW